jgi:hypothetical protein
VTRRPGQGLGPVAAVAVALLVPLAVDAEDAVPSPALKSALQAYHDSLSKLRWVVSDDRMADLYERALVFRDDAAVVADLAKFYEAASDTQKEALRETLVGVTLPGTGPPGPDRGFFRERSSSKDKTPESRDFFALLESLHPTDPKDAEKAKPARSCSRLGDGSLTDTLKRLEAPKVTEPFYRKVLLAERAPVVREMTTATCLCGERAAAQKELKGWLEKHFDDPAKAQLEARVKDLESNPAVRFRCGRAAP